MENNKENNKEYTKISQKTKSKPKQTMYYDNLKWSLISLYIKEKKIYLDQK